MNDLLVIGAAIAVLVVPQNWDKIKSLLPGKKAASPPAEALDIIRHYLATQPKASRDRGFTACDLLVPILKGETDEEA